MFGVVPKVLWAGLTTPDERNRIPLATRTLLAVDRGTRRVVLVDTGCGTKWAAREAERYAIQHDAAAIPTALRSLGLNMDDVSDVVVTHLHFDHNGGLTEWVGEAGGATRLVFPNARHWLHERHEAHAREPHLKDRASFLPEDFAILADSKCLSRVHGNNPSPPFEGMEWLVSQGHTPFQLLPCFVAGDQRLQFVGDLFPTVAHLRPTWVMAYDVEPMRTIDEKSSIVRNCLKSGVLLAFAHEPGCAAVKIEGPVERPIVVQSLDLSFES
jgi:glyoxylase-like metal-dependent hydrolase (beta-lactamase superfamily II)